jgi:hypothetical protein
MCARKDDLIEVLEGGREAGLLDLASPVYYSDIFRQLIAFMGGTFSFLAPDLITNPKESRLAPGKELVLILAKEILARTCEQHFSKVLLPFPSLRLCLVTAHTTEHDLQMARTKRGNSMAIPILKHPCVPQSKPDAILHWTAEAGKRYFPAVERSR